MASGRTPGLQGCVWSGDGLTRFLTSSVGARASWSYRQDTQFDVRAVWSRESRSFASDLSGRLVSSTSDARFTVGGVPVERDALTFGVGLSGV